MPHMAPRLAGVEPQPKSAGIWSRIDKLKAKMDELEIEEAFKYHQPKEGQNDKYNAIRAKGKELALLILASCPKSREASLAITHVQEATMFANAAIAIHS